MNAKGRKRSTETLAEHLWRSVAKAGDDECWLWTGSVTSTGYGQLTHHNEHYFVHRLSYSLHHGTPYRYDRMPDGQQVSICHACDVKLCVNPAHLWKGTQSENTLDAFRKGLIKPSTWLLERMEIAQQKRAAKAKAKTERSARMAAGIERKRNALGQFGEVAPVPRLRDAMGRMIRRGQKLPEPKRDARGLFLPR